MRRVNVIGVGMVPFQKPGKSDDYPEMSKKAMKAAFDDAGVPFTEVQQAYVGYVYGDSTCGQRAVYEMGQTGIPVFNVNNNCSTGSTALMLARQAIAGGMAECVLALGFEKMEKGALGAKWDDHAVLKAGAAYERARSAVLPQPRFERWQPALRPSAPATAN